MVLIRDSLLENKSSMTASVWAAGLERGGDADHDLETAVAEARFNHGARRRVVRIDPRG
jgi:hypothetical protein